jgi:hypothetical protein
MQWTQQVATWRISYPTPAVPALDVLRHVDSAQALITIELGTDIAPS